MAVDAAYLALLLLLTIAAPSRACGAGSCDLSADGIYSCEGYWPDPVQRCAGQPLLCSNSSAANRSASNLLIAPVPCSPCVGAPAGSPCQTVRANQWRSTAEVNGVCMPAGVCVSCGSFTDEASCTAFQNATIACTDPSFCTWGGGECRMATAPGVAIRGVNTLWPANKGGAPFDMWSVETIAEGCGIAGICSGNDDRDQCEKTHGCTWNHSQANCGGCSCQCDGCLSPPDANGEQTCWSVDYNTSAQCAAIRGEWCACNAPTSCSNALNRDTCMANAAPETATTTGACTWDAALLVDKLNGQELGGCLECAAHSGCVTGNCEARLVDESVGYGPGTNVKSRCGTCSDEAFCNGHGTAAHQASGECKCSCDTGWSGSQCEVADCTAGLTGEHCATCQASSCNSTKWPFKRYDGSAQCECTASDGSAQCTADGRCGARALQCGEADIKSCGPGGKVMGDDYRKLCYCQCAPGHYGTYCTETAPPKLLCGGSAGGRSDSTFTLVVTNQNDVAIDLRLCNRSKCVGKQYRRCATVHPISTWSHTNAPEYFTGMLPPRETVQLELPTNTQFAVFVDGKCGDAAAELYPPKGGWPSTLSYEVPTMCGDTPHAPNSCTFFDCGSQHHNWFYRGYYGGDTVPVCSNALRPISPTSQPLQADPVDAVVPCNQTMCCCARTGIHSDSCDPFGF